MKFISLFAGIGGFDLALRRQGHECVWANEWDKYAAQIYDKNFSQNTQSLSEIKQDQERGNRTPNQDRSDSLLSGHSQSTGNRIDTRDIRTVPTSDIPDHDLLVGGFPCQAFSIAGKRRGFNDTRGTLFFEIARILREKQPRLCILENVKGLLSHDNGNTFKTIISTLVELGYDIQWQVLNSKNFGVPQNRERVFIIGHLRGTSRPEVFPVTRSGWKTATVAGYISEEDWPRRHEQIRRVYKTDGAMPTIPTGTGGGVMTKIAVPVLTPDRPEKRQNGRRFKEDGEPSFTLNTQDKHGVYNGSQIRRLTPTECERLQGFPDGWAEGVSDTQRYKMCGNAVTVNVVEWIVSRL
jgi:DNA (cytosine-5)-methyltransferase 1